MDVRSASEDIQIREMVYRIMAEINTIIPGVIDAFNPSRQTCTVVPGVMMRTTIDGVQSAVPLPPIVEAPLVFPFFASAQFAITGPVRKGDPCLIVFSQRAIDNWHERGPQPQTAEEGVGCRSHDLTDAFVMLAPAPLPLAITGWNDDGIQIRSTNPAKDIKISLTDSKVELQHTANKLTLTATGLEIDSTVTFKKAVTFQSTATLSTAVELTTHKHTSAAPGNPTGVPIP